MGGSSWPGNIEVWLKASLIALAFGLSMFFVGPNAQLLCLVLGLLLTWIAWTVAQGYDRGIALPRTALAVAMALYGGWLGITLFWNPVTSIGVLTLFWMMTWLLAFYGFVLDPARERVWQPVTALILIAALLLAGAGLYQWFVHSEIPIGPFLDQNLFSALLTLVALPVGAAFLREPKRPALWAAVFLVLLFAIAFAKGRGPALALFAGLVALAAMTYRSASIQRLAMLGALALAAYVLANLGWGGGVVDRVATLQNPQAAGHTRFLIWEGSWRMLMDHPWFGIGLGIYPLLWPPYHHPDDSTAGFFVHNDYLQLWLDAGIPGLLLFLAVIACWGRLMLMLRGRRLAKAEWIEAAGLGAAFGSLLINSMFTYNFYVVPTLIAAGLILGRLQIMAEQRSDRFVLRPASLVSRPAFRVLTVLLLLLVLSWFVSIAIANIFSARGVAQANRGEYDAADASLSAAQQLWPGADSILTTRADLYRHVLSAGRGADADNRREVFDAARAMLGEAQRLNPLRPEPRLVLAELLRHNPELAGEGWRESARENYEAALALNPWYFGARETYGRYLLSKGREPQARAVLEAGMQYAYNDPETIIPYFMLTAQLRRRAGETAAADALESRARGIAERKQNWRARQAAKESIPVIGWIYRIGNPLR